MYVDDGISVEIDQTVRLKASTSAWEFFTMGLLGRNAINEDKLKEDGQWSHSHIILGMEFYADSLCVRIPGAKVDGARILLEQILEEKGSRLLHVKTLHRIRGIMDHSKHANVVRAYLAAPVDSLVCFGGERIDWAVCPNKEIWVDFWYAMAVVGTHMRPESAWRNLPDGRSPRATHPAEWMSLKLGNDVLYGFQ